MVKRSVDLPAFDELFDLYFSALGQAIREASEATGKSLSASAEDYQKLLEQLEAIAKENPHIIEAHAIQAGREVRVILDAKRADDATAFAIAEAIAKRIEAEMTFPGEIKVTVLREVRAEAIAR